MGGDNAPEIVINAIGVTKSFKAAGAVVAGSGGSGGDAAASAVCC